MSENYYSSANESSIIRSYGPFKIQSANKSLQFYGEENNKEVIFPQKIIGEKVTYGKEFIDKSVIIKD